MSTIPDEQAALLAAIVAHPDEDTPRLVYADWLQEHGDEEQATFIRASVARMPEETLEREAEETRLSRIAAKAGPQWLGRLGLRLMPVLTRGLIESAGYFALADFWSEAETLFRLMPVRSLTLSDGQADSPELDEGLHKLARMPQLTRLRRLGFWLYAASSAGWAALFASPHLAGLTELSLDECGVGPEAVESLAATPAFARLTMLNLCGNPIGLRGARALIRSPHLAGLQGLYLEHCLGDERGGKTAIRELKRRFGSVIRLM